MIDFVVAFVLFNVTCFLIPVFIFNYGYLKIIHGLWLSILSIFYPELDFLKYSTIRTLLDTHRNQGVISVLLTVKGAVQLDSVKRHLLEVTKRRNKNGQLAFPRLQQCLTTKCGVYAWQKCLFDLEQQIILAPFTYKGRAVTEHNIQEYVSDAVSKYFPNSFPPWQVILFPSSEDRHYILLKIHHVLLSEGVNIGDILPLIPPTRQSANIPSKSPLVEVFKKPVFIPKLKEKISEEFCNKWNEVIANCDPLENHKLYKETPTIRQFIAICLITFISCVKESRKGFRIIKNDAASKIKYVLLTILRECNKRQVTLNNFFKSVIKTGSPKHVITLILELIWFTTIALPIRVPIAIYKEIVAVYYCVYYKYCPFPNTLTGMIYMFVPLIYNSFKEVWYIFSIIFFAPKNITQDILMQDESLEIVTLCGRKAVAWSDQVKIDEVKDIAEKSGVTETEVKLAVISSCLSKYFGQTCFRVPEQIPITIRNINSYYLLATGPNVKVENAVSGILCLNLPTIDSNQSITQLDNLAEIQARFQEALEKQGLSHLLTMFQTKLGILTRFLPETVVSIYLKYLSRKYAITVTEVSNRYPNVKQRTLWGQEVSDVIYWRPPQANTCISLCLNEYADHIGLAVMCDAQLAPHHPILIRGFPEFIKDLFSSVKHI